MDLIYVDMDQNQIVKLVTLLVNNGVDVNGKVENIPLISYILDRSPLKMDKNIEIVELLLKKGANIDAPDKEGTTLLAHCVAKNKDSCVEVLLEKGANCNVLYQGKTLVDIAQGHINDYMNSNNDKEKARRILELLTPPDKVKRKHRPVGIS